jgi:hypothetical protein
VQGDVFHSQRAAAHRVRCLTLLLLIPRSQGQLHSHTHTLVKEMYTVHVGTR